MRLLPLLSSLLAFLAILVACLFLRSSDLARLPLWFPRCAVHELTGLHCPGCGNTRAAHALLHGDVGGALRQNALCVIALPFLVYHAWRAWLGWVDPRRRRPQPFVIRQWHVVVVVTLFFLFTVLRNLPFAPFDWLAPDPVTRAPGG